MPPYPHSPAITPCESVRLYPWMWTQARNHKRHKIEFICDPTLSYASYQNHVPGIRAGPGHQSSGGQHRRAGARVTVDRRLRSSSSFAFLGWSLAKRAGCRR